MASKDHFRIAFSSSVAPILCTECGNNMHCVRRSPAPGGEHQRFACATCGATSERIFTMQASDSDIEREAERMSGIPGRAA